MDQTNSDRRRDPRLGLAPMYTSVGVTLVPDGAEELDGHAYDVSRGGVCLELDEAIAPGSPVRVRVELPRAGSIGLHGKRALHAFGRVVWLSEEEPGPVRMAVVFTDFQTLGDECRLDAYLADRFGALAA